ncbi:15631_t:CDS:10 [Funneliformis caledonium]|uniref:Autophagy-related protein n=1 Tax=Funneliformis caledonium TaxID=1117310 RepID=A0A9N8VBZ6_9GLOM|nr:15631_t:CDS:10 [Funneliformis caledonium]
MSQLTQEGGVEQNTPNLVHIILDEEVATNIPEDNLDELTNRELNGWKLYQIGSGAFTPMQTIMIFVLTTLVAESGFELDRQTPCKTEVAGYKCVNKFVFWYIDTSNYNRYIFAITTVVQCILFLFLGSLADFGGYRKKFLFFFSYVGAFAAVLFLLVLNPQLYWLAGLLSITAIACTQIAIVFYFAYIPTYTRLHPEVIESKASHLPLEEITKVQDKVSTSFTTHSMGISFISFIINCLAQIGIGISMNHTLYSQSVSIAFSGIWGIIFYTIPFYFMRNRENPPLPSGQKFYTYSIKRFFHTLPKLYHLKEFSKYLIASLLIGDSMANHLGTMTTLVMQLQPSFTLSEVAIGAIIFPIGGFFGVYLFLFIQKKFGLSVKAIMLISVGCYSLVQIFELLGHWAKPIDTFTNDGLYWFITVCSAICIGLISTYKRLLGASLMPPNADNEFTTLIGIMDNITSWITPLILVAITDVSHVENGKVEGEIFVNRRKTK